VRMAEGRREWRGRGGGVVLNNTHGVCWSASLAREDTMLIKYRPLWLMAHHRAIHARARTLKIHLYNLRHAQIARVYYYLRIISNKLGALSNRARYARAKPALREGGGGGCALH